MAALLAKIFDHPEEIVKMANDAVEDPGMNIPSVQLMVEDALDAGRIKKEAGPDSDASLKKCIDQTFLNESFKQEVRLK